MNLIINKEANAIRKVDKDSNQQDVSKSTNKFISNSSISVYIANVEHVSIIVYTIVNIQLINLKR